MTPISSSLTSIFPTIKAGVFPLLRAVSRIVFALSRKDGENDSFHEKLNDIRATRRRRRRRERDQARWERRERREEEKRKWERSRRGRGRRRRSKLREKEGRVCELNGRRRRETTRPLLLRLLEFEFQPRSLMELWDLVDELPKRWRFDSEKYMSKKSEPLPRRKRSP